MHKCEYCESTIQPCMQPCIARNEEGHVCCTCTINSDDTKCELPERIVCNSSLCNLKYSVDYYKNRLDEVKAEVKLNQDKVSALIALVNEWRLVNVGSPQSNIIDIIAKGALSVPSVKLFVSKQRLSWDRFPVDVGYTIMCLHEEFTKQWSEWINQKAVKVSIKKDLIDKTNNDLKNAQKMRDKITNSDGTEKTVKQKKATLTPYEKVVAHNMRTLNLNQQQAESFAQSMGMKQEPCRNLKELGVI